MPIEMLENLSAINLIAKILNKNQFKSCTKYTVLVSTFKKDLRALKIKKEKKNFLRIFLIGFNILINKFKNFLRVRIIYLL